MDGLDGGGKCARAADFQLESEAPLHSFILASDLSENRFALFGPMF
jgi:hypothetical protein